MKIWLGLPLYHTVVGEKRALLYSSCVDSMGELWPLKVNIGEGSIDEVTYHKSNP